MSSTTKTLGVLGGLALVGLNVAVVAFYVLWQMADTAAINQMEAAPGMDGSQMLPNANALWLAANASFILLLVLDIVVIVLVATRVNVHRRASAMAVSHARRSHSVR